jgi:hypothetical protein
MHEGQPPEQARHQRAHHRHASGAADHHDAVEVAGSEPGVADCALDGRAQPSEEGRGVGFEGIARDRSRALGIGERKTIRCHLAAGQVDLDPFRGSSQTSPVNC